MDVGVQLKLVSDSPKTPTPLLDISVIMFSQSLLLGFIPVSFGKLTERLPVCDSVAMTRRTVGGRLKVSGLSFALEP